MHHEPPKKAAGGVGVGGSNPLVPTNLTLHLQWLERVAKAARWRLRGRRACCHSPPWASTLNRIENLPVYSASATSAQRQQNEAAVQTDSSVNGAGAILILLLLLVGLFLIVDVLGRNYDAGIFSFLSAIQAARDHVASIDVDRQSLRTVFIAACVFVVAGFVWLVEVQFNKLLLGIVVVVPLVAGGLLDHLYGPGVVQSLMATHGYARCAAHDHLSARKNRALGSVRFGPRRYGSRRRLRVTEPAWLDNYLPANQPCLPAPQA